MEAACVKCCELALKVSCSKCSSQSEGPSNCASAIGVELRYRVLLSDVPSLRLYHQFELVRLEQRIVPELERKIRRLLKLLRQVALFLEHVHHDIRVQLHQQIVAPPFHCHPLHRTLHPPHDRFGGEHSTSSVASRT